MMVYIILIYKVDKEILNSQKSGRPRVSQSVRKIEKKGETNFMKELKQRKTL